MAGQIKCGFFGSTASSFWPTLNSFLGGRGGGVLKKDSGANTFSPAVCISFSKNLGHLDKSLPKPSGGDILRPFLNEY